MTEPDEALLWARERAKRRFSAPTAASRDICVQIDAGKHDGELEIVDASAYRAGAAASEARIKALEEALRPLAALAEKIGTIRYGDIQRARALLKEGDQ